MPSARLCASVPTVRPETSDPLAWPRVSHGAPGGVQVTIVWLSLAVNGRLNTLASVGSPATGSWANFDGTPPAESSTVSGTDRNGEPAMSTDRSGTDRSGADAGTDRNGTERNG